MSSRQSRRGGCHPANPLALSRRGGYRLQVHLLKQFFLLCFLCLAAAGAVSAAPAVQPGFRTLGVWKSETSLRLNLAIWYPARRTPTQLDYGDWTFRASRNASPVTGKHPLIILSHDSSGSRFSLHQLAGALAREGFVVVAPTHPGDNLDDLSWLFTTEQLTGRARDISATLDVIFDTPVLEAMTDPTRVGLLGVGPGGAAALLAAGACPDPAGWTDYCARAALARQAAGQASSRDKADALLYCSDWAVPRMAATAADPELPKSRRDGRVRAVAVVAPWYGMFFSAEALASVRIPVLLVSAENDRRNPSLFHVEAIRKALPNPPAHVVLPDADAASLLSPCSPSLAETWPELCRGADARLRRDVQDKLARAACAFFLEHLGGVSAE